MDNTSSHTDPYKNYDKDFVHIVEEIVTPVEVKNNKNVLEEKPKKTSWIKNIFIFLLLLCILVCVSVAYVYYAFSKKIQPQSTASSTPVTIDIVKGTPLQKVVDTLDENKLIYSPFLFRAALILGGFESSIKTGEYTFTKEASMTDLIERLIKGRYEYVPLKLIIREGESSTDIAPRIHGAFKNIAKNLSQEQVQIELRKREGKLFPETYTFAPFDTLDTVLVTIDKEYKKRIAKYSLDIQSSGKTEEEILTLASILEREVPHPEDMRVVSGIIYNRLQKNMPLQMDSTLGYITGKASLELTLEDLRIDSPYNTYKNPGLPQGPIGNPGDASIDAALHPETHGYIFFLSDSKGVNHYAENYSKHLQNRKIYLGK
jgi:UPF0755 protein